ncbi:MAG: translation initiation factor IF-5A [Candidatus Aenigmarchaeota archaeon]|nr:translation initiation factor IF-5A [Candidatus Aenigmarchaeota archaeon]
METIRKAIKELKEGDLVIIENVPCRVESVSTSVSGKHGAAKTRVEAIGIFDGKRRSIVQPADEDVEVPIIKRKKAQVLAIVGNNVQLMDLETYEMLELEIPEEKRNKLKEGEETWYYEIMGIRTLRELK